MLRKLLWVLVPVTALVVLTPGTSFAAWTTRGSGTGAASATTVGQPAVPGVVAGPGIATVTWSVTKTASGVSAGSYDVYRHSGASSTLICSMVTTTTCTDASPLAGAVQYGVVARVGANWKGPESSLTGFTYDSTAPTTTLSKTPSAPNGAGWYSSNVTVTLTASDAATTPNSGVASIKYSLNGGATQTVNASSTSLSVTAEQSNTLSYWAVDNNGNTESANSAAAIKIDKTAPTTTILPASSATWHATATSVTLTGTDATSGVASTSYRIGASGGYSTYSTAFAAPEGNNTIYYFSTDNAGNAETAKTATVKVDTVAPTSTASPTSGTTPRTVTLTGSDASSGVASIVYKIDGGTPTTVNATSASVSIASGYHTLTWHAVDNAGNVEADHVGYYGDTTAPSITAIGPTSGSTYASGNNGSTSWSKVCGSGAVCATVTDAISGVSTVTYTLTATSGSNSGKYWNGTVFATGSTANPTTASGSTYQGVDIARALMSAGNYTLVFTATDVAGNTSTLTVTFATS